MHKKSYTLIYLLLIISSFTFFSCKEKLPAKQEETTVQDTLIPVQAKKLYGIEIDSLNITEGKVRRNQTLAVILSKLDIPYYKIQTIIDNSGDTFDFRKVKLGNKYIVYSKKGSAKTVQYFVYIDNPIDYFVFDFGDSPNVSHMKREVHSDLKTASGVIESSLWLSMKEKKYNPVLAIELSDIFAWTIDFFGIQKGDSYKIIYDEQFVDTLSVGINRILAAYFHHAGEDFYAIPFIQDGREDYYDQDGASLRKAFLKAPLRYSRISSRYSNSRYHPVLKIRRPHHGVDYAAPTGTPVHTIGDGKVIAVKWAGGGGRMVKVKHNSVYTTTYMHLSRYGKGMTPGKYIKQGDIVGYVGMSGLATGPHLDFRVYKNGHPINPLKMKAPPVKPVSEENMPEYQKISRVMISLLDDIKEDQTMNDER